MTFPRYWKRGVRVTIPGLGPVTQPRIDFELRRHAQDTPSSGSVTLWNLSPSSSNAVADSYGKEITVEAGYDGRLDPISLGQVRRVDFERVGVARRVRIAVGDKREILGDGAERGVTVQSWRGAEWIGTLVQQAVSDLNLETGDTSLLPSDQVINFSWSGRSADLLRVLLVPRGIDWYVDGNVVMFTRVNAADPVPPTRIDPGNGMLGSPLIADDTLQKVRVRLLLNPALSLAAPVSLRSEVRSGEFKIVAIVHRGTNRKGPFYTEVDLWNV